MEKVEVLQRSVIAYKGQLTRASKEAEDQLKLRTRDTSEIQAALWTLENKWTRMKGHVIN